MRSYRLTSCTHSNRVNGSAGALRMLLFCSLDVTHQSKERKMRLTVSTGSRLKESSMIYICIIYHRPLKSAVLSRFTE
jgi:hypothetical protein